jgi:hypothetical protein
MCGDRGANVPPYLRHASIHQVGSRNNEMGRYFRGEISELLVWGTALSPLDVAAAHAYLRAKWGLPSPPPGVCGSGDDPLAFQVNQKFAVQRFQVGAVALLLRLWTAILTMHLLLQVAIQSRGHRFPVRFNGQLFLSNLPPHADERRWGM